MAEKQKKDKKAIRAMKEARTQAHRKVRDARIERRQAYFQRRAEDLVGRRAIIAGVEGTITDLIHDKSDPDLPGHGMKGRVFEIVTQNGTFYRNRKRLKLA